MFRRSLVVVLLAFGSFLGAAGAASGHANVPGVWMAGPGCTGYEWFQHPEELPYFCDGAAIVESIAWRSWGASKATASAIMNEANPGPGDSMESAPRTHRAATITASQIKVCGGHRAYTRIVIRLRRAVHGVKELQFGSFLPKCSAHRTRSERRSRALQGGGTGRLPLRAAAIAPCTKNAIEAGLRRSGTRGHLIKSGDFECAGRFAFAVVLIGDDEAVELLRSYGRRWEVVDRGKYCEAGKVPAKIRYEGCEVS